MNSESEFSWIIAKDFVDQAVLYNTGKHLSDIEIMVIQGAWEGKTYDDIARIYGYSVEYLNKDVGNKLWHKLSEYLGERVTKKNFKEALRRAWNQQIYTSLKKKSEVRIQERSAGAAEPPVRINQWGIQTLQVISDY